MYKTALAGLLLTLALPLSADVLILDEVRQVESMDVPENGQNKAEVETRFGSPTKRHAPVGEPPITRWDYATWSVYFENDLVLYTVLAEGQPVKSS
jgi:hypothetical protein